MGPSLTTHQPLLVNTIGHAAGAVIFAGFLFLFLRSQRGSRPPGFWLSALAASLALLWNLGSLIALGLSEAQASQVGLLVSCSFSVLSCLPAVLLHLSLERRFPSIWLTGYVLSGAAVLLHFGEFFGASQRYHHFALQLITLGFGLLTLASVLLISRTPKERRGSLRSRIFVSMSLFLFAVSFVHFGVDHVENVWTHELAVHHAGIPLALIVLLQDYRLLLLDVFLRFLGNALLAAGWIVAVISLEYRFGLWQAASDSPFILGLLLIGSCLLLIAFASLRNNLQAWLTSVVFRRSDLEVVLGRLRAHASRARSEPGFLQQAGRELADFLNVDPPRLVEETPCADAVEWRSLLPVLVGDRSLLRSTPETNSTEVILPLRLSAGDARYFLLGRRMGGRRYLSEDLQDLATLSSVIVEQVEKLRRTEMQRLVSQAELRALRAQINPHFLFNALNALYGIIPREIGGARRTVLNLAEIFRYFLQADKEFIPLADELRIVKAYLEIESLRLGSRLTTEIDVTDAVLSHEIPILSVQPLVENAVKHGVSLKPDGGAVRLKAWERDGALVIQVQDTGDGFSESPADGGGVGLENVRRRLRLCYGSSAELTIDSRPEETIAELIIPILQPATVP